MTGLYFHIPFCRHKCLYCDFYTGGERIADWKRFLNCLINELKERKNEIISPVSTIYFGGGTPSLIPSEDLQNFIRQLKDFVDFSLLEEFTIEVNPEDINEEKIKLWDEIGVNRISVGAQSFIDSELKILGRHHSSELSKKIFWIFPKALGIFQWI